MTTPGKVPGVAPRDLPAGCCRRPGQGVVGVAVGVAVVAAPGVAAGGRAGIQGSGSDAGTGAVSAHIRRAGRVEVGVRDPDVHLLLLHFVSTGRSTAAPFAAARSGD
ncbi:MAG TPA: hypothetical protein VMU89_15425 [Thermomicrobiaceae bacterium]|nr:hypothetical protein [Thermomicrobiaceae bacterium]